jgi:transposase-like protein
MAEMRRMFNHDIDIKRAARELGIERATLRQWLDTAEDEELLKRRVELAVRGGGTENVARSLGVDEETLRQWLDTADDAKLMKRAAGMASRGGTEQVAKVARLLEINEKTLNHHLWELRYAHFTESPPS